MPKYRHHLIATTALPYISTASATEERLHYVRGSNVVTSLHGYLARRPGLLGLTSPDQQFANPVRRFFTWRRWAGAYFIMLNEVTATQSIVYKKQQGTDNLFISIFTSASTNPFDFTTANNHVYFGNGVDMKKYDGTTVTNWGIAKPATAPSATGTPGSIDAVNGGYRWRIAFANSNTGHIGQISNATPVTGNFTDRDYTIAGVTTTDPQVTHVHVYRTTDGGAEFFELPNSPVAYSGSWNLLDSADDVQLLTNTASLVNQNAPPPPGSGVVFFAGRIWVFNGDTVYFSNFEEQVEGVEEESFDTRNAYPFGAEVTALAVVQRALLVFTASNIFRVRGDTVDTFIRESFIGRRGVQSMNHVAANGTRSVAWLDTSNTVFASDGLGVYDVGRPIRRDFTPFVPTGYSCAFHANREQNWLIVMSSSIRWVFDLDNGIWMVPWTVGGTAIYSGETAQGVFTLMMAVQNGVNDYRIRTLSTSFTDAGSQFSAYVMTNGIPLAQGKGSGELGNVEIIALERNENPASDVSFILDVDPNLTLETFTSIFANERDAPNRSQTVQEYLYEKWYFARTGTGRRVSIRIDWPVHFSEFKLFTIDIIGNELMQY